MRVAGEFPQTARYRVRRKLGAGGMGAVYEADDLERGERVAVKVLVRRDARLLLRFKNEFRALQDLEHPNLVRLGELIEVDGSWMFSMELVEGHDIVRYLRAGSPAAAFGRAPTEDPAQPGGGAPRSRAALYDEAQLRTVFQDLARGLDALHGAGKIHRDVKPSNVLVTREGRVVLLDFGLVTDTAEGRRSTDLNVVGTAAYMAPEQARSKAVGPAADWYSFGVVLYEALTGTTPFIGAPLEMLMDKQRHDPPPPRALRPDTPRDLDQLCVDLLHFDPDERPSGHAVLRRLGAAEAAAPSTRRWATGGSQGQLFVGRAEELTALHACFATTRSGTPALVFVHGPSGIGKTQLVARFLEEVQAAVDDVLILRGRCYEREQVPFKAVDGVVDELSTALQHLPIRERYELMPHGAALLPTLFPVLARIDAIAEAPWPRPGPADPSEERLWAFAALRELTRRVCERQLVIMAIDDFQWADDDSLALLRALLGSGERPAVLLIATSREPAPTASGDEDPAALPWTSMELGPLERDDGIRLADRLLADAGGAAGLRSAELAEEAGGHPLFLAELVRYTTMGGRPQGARVALDEAIWARVCELPRPARAVVEFLAVATTPLSRDALERATDLRGAELERTLALLRVAALARTSGSTRAQRVGPYHDRVREAVMRKIDEERLRRHHARLATVLEADPGVAPESVAYHAESAGLTSKAVACYERAAARAIAGLAFERGVFLYRRVLALGRPSPAKQSAIHVAIGDALAHAGRGVEAAAEYTLALDGANAADQIRLRTLSASLLLRSGHVREGMAGLEEVMQVVGLSIPRSRAGAIASYVSHSVRLRLRGYRFRERDPSELSQTELIRIDALAGVAEGLTWIDGIRAAGVATRWLKGTLDAGEPRRVVRALGLAAGMVSLGGRPREQATRRILARAKEIAAPLEEPRTDAYVIGAEALAANHECRFADLDRHSARLLELVEDLCDYSAWELATARLTRLFGLLMTGQFAQFVALAERFLRDAEERRDRWFASLLRVLLAPYVTLARDDDPAASHALLERGIEPWRERSFGLIHYNWLVSATRVDLYAGNADTALARLRAHAADIRRSGSLRAQLLRIVVTSTTAGAHLARYRTSRDPADLVAARRRARTLLRERTEYAEGLANTILAAIAEHRGQLDTAITHLELAEASFIACGAGSFAMIPKHRRGALLGGDEGRALVADVEAYCRRERVANPAAFVRSAGFPPRP